MSILNVKDLKKGDLLTYKGRTPHEILAIGEEFIFVDTKSSLNEFLITVEKDGTIDDRWRKHREDDYQPGDDIAIFGTIVSRKPDPDEGGWMYEVKIADGWDEITLRGSMLDNTEFNG